MLFPFSLIASQDRNIGAVPHTMFVVSGSQFQLLQMSLL